jgi:hypothetical protein
VKQQLNGTVNCVYGTTGNGIGITGRESGSTSALYAFGADASTNGIMELRTIRQDGSNQITAIKYDGTGAVTLGPASGTTSTIHSVTNRTTTATTEAFQVIKQGIANNAANNVYMYFLPATGNDGYIGNNGSGVLGLVDSSDIRWKENIRDASYGLTTIKALRPVEFDWKSGIKNVKGFIAQEVKEVLPESIIIRATDDLEDAHFLETHTMIPVLVKAVQELAAINDSQAAMLAELTAANAELKASVDDLQAQLAAQADRIAALESK